MSNTFFISDTHFGHNNIIKYSNRPFQNVDEMNNGLVENWNALVKPGDRVYHMGDVAFMPFHLFTKEILSRLNGKINIILGNHDRMITDNEKDLLMWTGGNARVDSIQSYREIKIAGQDIVLFHYGMRVWNRSHRGAIMLYGHSHGSLPPFGKSVDVGVDSKEITSEYRPVNFDEVIEYMSHRTGETVDHHVMAD